MRVGLCLVVSGLTAGALAGPTGCCVIPIADILKHREVFAYYGVSGNERNVDKSVGHAWSINVGLFDRVEVGFDNDTMGGTLLHGKVNLYEATTQDMGLTVGWMNWSVENTYAEPYLVGRYGFANGPRLHVGTTRNDRWRVMLGADYSAGDWTWAVDWTSGPNSTTWAGFTYGIARVPGLSVSAYVGLPSVKADGIQHQVLLNYALKF